MFKARLDKRGVLHLDRELEVTHAERLFLVHVFPPAGQPWPPVAFITRLAAYVGCQDCTMSVPMAARDPMVLPCDVEVELSEELPNGYVDDGKHILLPEDGVVRFSAQANVDAGGGIYITTPSSWYRGMKLLGMVDWLNVAVSRGGQNLANYHAQDQGGGRLSVPKHATTLVREGDRLGVEITKCDVVDCQCPAHSRKPTEHTDECFDTEYGIWAGIKSRCTNPGDARYKWYGARGITMCSEWQLSCTAFLQHVGKRPSRAHSIDRIDNERGYEPGNLRWATPTEQNRNTRATIRYEYNGQSKTLAEWAEEHGLTYDQVYQRVEKYGWTLDKALTTPIGSSGGGRSQDDERTRMKAVWYGMIHRCHNPNSERYDSYGGRGIVVCERWRTSFDDYLNDVGARPSPQHSLDRIDNNRGYEPGNLRWATATEQNHNRRCTQRYELFGETLTLTEWAERAGMPYDVVKKRILEYHWPLDEALGTPIGFGRCPADERRKWNGRR